MSPREPSIELLLLKPLGILFGGPLSEPEKVYYIDAVRMCIDTQLNAMFIHLRDNHRYKRFPTVAEIQDAKKATSGKEPYSSRNDGQKQKMPWEALHDRIDSLTNEYVKQFMVNTPMAGQASREGWDMALWRYVSKCAHHQAQMICKAPHVGWDGFVIFNYRTDLSKEEVFIFMKEQRAQAETGVIDVAVPVGHIDSWRQQAAQKAQKAAPAGPTIQHQHIGVNVQKAVNHLDMESVF